MSKVKIIGHRGAANHTENTIPSFESAIEQKVDGIELDVRASSDGQLMVIHDSVVGEHAVKATPYATLKQLPNGYEAPLLEEVLKRFGKKTFLDIELKHDGIEEAAVALIKRYCNPEKTMISGFDAEALSKVHELLPELQLGYIYNRTQDEEARHNCPIDVVIPQFRLASRELIEEVHDEGLAVWAWTVNEEDEVRRLVNLGVDGLITDHPDKVRAWLAG